MSYDSVSIKSLGGRPLPCVVIGGCNARRPTRCFWSKRTLQLEEQQWHWAALYFSPPRLCLSEKCMLPNYPVPYIGCFKIEHLTSLRHQDWPNVKPKWALFTLCQGQSFISLGTGRMCRYVVIWLKHTGSPFFPYAWRLVLHSKNKEARFRFSTKCWSRWSRIPEPTGGANHEWGMQPWQQHVTTLSLYVLNICTRCGLRLKS